MCVYIRQSIITYVLYIHFAYVHTYIDSLVAAAPPQANIVTTSTRRQWEITTPQEVMTRETTTVPVWQRDITAPTEQLVSEPHECHDDFSM